MNRIAVVIPCIRPFKAWPEFEAQLPKNADVFVCGEDKNVSGIEDCTFFKRKDYDKCPNSLRGLDFAFAHIFASKYKYEAVISFDDDTAPLPARYVEPRWENFNFFRRHLDALQYNLFNDKYINPIRGAYTRGIPYGDRRNGRVVLHQGLWTNEGDINTIDKLVAHPKPGEPKPVALEPKWKQIQFEPINFGIVPHGFATTISSMNISFRSEIIPAYFQPPLFRADDIWSGLILKRIADHLGDYVTFGKPFVSHNQAPRDPLRDVILERNGFPINERLWKDLQAVELRSKSYFECARELADSLQWEFSRQFMDWLEFLEGKYQ